MMNPSISTRQSLRFTHSPTSLFTHSPTHLPNFLPTDKQCQCGSIFQLILLSAPSIERVVNPHNSLMLTILFCGVLGGLATVLGKLSFSSDNVVLNQFSLFCFETTLMSDGCYYLTWLVRAFAFGFMFACNAMVIGYF